MPDMTNREVFLDEYAALCKRRGLVVALSLTGPAYRVDVQSANSAKIASHVNMLRAEIKMDRSAFVAGCD